MALAPGQPAITSARLNVLRLDAGRLNAAVVTPRPPLEPSAPTPGDGAQASPYTLTWAAGGADAFDVYFGTSSTPPLVSSNQAANSYTLPALTAGTPYYWRIVAKNDVGDTPGPVWTFTAVAAAVGAPAPANGAIDVTSQPTLTWQGTGTYKVYFGPVGAAVLVSTQALNSYTPGQLQNGTAYEWRIEAVNNAGTAASPAWRFTTAAIAVPSNPSPADGAITSSQPTLTWEWAEGDGVFRVYFGPVGAAVLVSTQTGQTYVPGQLTNGTPYEWRIEAQNDSGTATSPVWRFSTAVLEAPSNPIPPHNARRVPRNGTVLEWTAPAGAAAYDLYFGTTNPPPLVGIGITAPSYPLEALTGNTRYFWRVVARSPGGDTSGPIWAFSTASQTALVITIDGNTPHTRIEGLSITDVLNDAPNTCSFRVDREAPHVGQEVQIGLGSLDPAAHIFAGTIDTVEQTYEGLPRNAVWAVTCIDYGRRLNRHKVRRRYGQQSATLIAQDLLARYAIGFTGAAIAAGLPNVTGGIDFTDEDLATCFKRLAQRIGGYFYVDYQRDVHLFTSEVTEPPDPIVPGTRTLMNDPPIAHHVDLTQIRTRVYVEAGGSNARNSVAPGAIAIPVTDGTWYPGTGGLVASGPQRIRYTGKGQAGGPAAPTAAALLQAGSLIGGPYSYKVLIVNEGAEGPLSAATPPITFAQIAKPNGQITAVDGAPGAINPPGTPSVTPIDGAGLTIGTTYAWAWTFTTSNGETTIGGAPSATASARTAAMTGTFSATLVSGGTLTVDHFYEYCWTDVDAAGNEALPGVFMSPSSGIKILAGSQSVKFLHGIPSSPGWVKAQNIYRRDKTTSGPWQMIANVTNIYASPGVYFTDTGLSGGKPLPTVATAVIAQFDISVPDGPAGATGRKLYRRGTSGVFRLVTTVSGNSSAAPVRDSKPDASLGEEAPGTNTTGGGSLGTGYYQWIVSFCTANGGETDRSDAREIYVSMGGASLSSIPISSDPRVTSRRLYRSVMNGGARWQLEATLDTGSTTYSSTKSDGQLGAAFPDGGNRAATAIGAIQLTNLPIGPVTATERRIYRTAAGGGAYRLVATINDNTTTSYVDTKADSALGAIPAGDTITELIGIPATGEGAVLYDIRIGDEVNLIMQCDDVAAQNELKALEGGDSNGIYEHTMQDRRLSAGEATATGNADLALFARPIVTVRYASRDPKTRSGKTVHIDLPAVGISGHYTIQRVTISEIGIAPGIYPKYTVEASSTRYSFEDLLRQVLIAPTQQ